MARLELPERFRITATLLHNAAYSMHSITAEAALMVRALL
jgi:hypothetical protein